MFERNAEVMNLIKRLKSDPPFDGWVFNVGQKGAVRISWDETGQVVSVRQVEPDTSGADVPNIRTPDPTSLVSDTTDARPLIQWKE